MRGEGRTGATGPWQLSLLCGSLGATRARVRSRQNLWAGRAVGPYLSLRALRSNAERSRVLFGGRVLSTSQAALLENMPLTISALLKLSRYCVRSHNRFWGSETSVAATTLISLSW